MESLESRTFLASDYRIIDLGTLGGDTSVATAINDRGHVVGYSATEDGQTRAFIYYNGRMRNVGSPRGESRALDISNRGHVGGYFLNNSGSARGFVWRRTEGFTVMEDLVRKGTRNSHVYAVEKNGDAYGQSSNRPVVWREADPRALSSRPGAVFNVSDGRMPVGTLQDEPMNFRPPLKLDDANDGRALGVNNNREIVGWQSVGGDRQAVLWKLSASREFVLDTEVIGGLADNPGTDAEFSIANAINDEGIAVGSSLTAADSEGRHAFVWQNGEISDLNALLEEEDDGWLLVSANDINDRGQIVGTGIVNGQEHAFLLQPIEEGPDISVSLDGRELDDGDTVDFGLVGQSDRPPTREFVIRNEGRERLRIRGIDVPAGFELLDDLPAYLDAGEAESFRVALDTARQGIFRGPLTIRTTDPDERLFDIELRGQVRPQGTGNPLEGFPTLRPSR
jgi:probable HAF family extracellular repeat protein